MYRIELILLKEMVILKKVLMLLVIAFALIGCQSEESNTTEDLTEVNEEYKEHAREIADMIKTVHESGNQISDYEFDKYKEFMDIEQVDGRDLNMFELGIQLDLITLSDFLTGEYSGENTFDDEYENLIEELE